MTVAVIGGGYLGSLVSICLAHRGQAVTLYESRQSLLDGASFVGEGKIHLGLVYALGGTATARSMLRGALSFDAALGELLGSDLDWGRLRGSTFQYLVAPDSLVSEPEFMAHAERLESLRRDLVAENSDVTYLGARLESCVPIRIPGAARLYATEERYVQTAELSRQVRSAVESCRGIAVRTGTAVIAPQHHDHGWNLQLRGPDGEATTALHSVVVNCSWEDSVRLDTAAGLSTAAPNLRLRAFVHGRSASPPRAVTVVHGPYGDAVIRPDGTFYGSWYPSGLLGFAVTDTAPKDWSSALEDPRVRNDMISATLSGLTGLLPDLGQVFDPEVHARIVVADGDTDIDDPRSGLHRRQDGEVVSAGTWISPRSRKLTTIPATALSVAAVVGELT